MKLVWVFLKGGKGVWRGSKFYTLIFNSPKLDRLGREVEWKGLKIFKMSILPLICQIIFISLKLIR